MDDTTIASREQSEETMPGTNTSVGSSIHSPQILLSSKATLLSSNHANEVNEVPLHNPECNIILGKQPFRAPKFKRTKNSLQQYLDTLLTSRGYSTETRRTLETGYYNAKPTPLQKASYNTYLINLARSGLRQEFESIMNCGVSSNPCNKHGESLVHIVCQRCDHLSLAILLNAGASLQVSDDYGRTPLHDACWRAEPSFQIIEMIGNHDLNLFHLTDRRGSLPLSYVHSDHWEEWMDFLDSKKDLWWPLKTTTFGNVSNSLLTFNLLDSPPNARSIPDPEKALSPEIAVLVTAGRITPTDALLLNMDDDETVSFQDDYSESEEDDYSSDSFSKDDDSFDISKDSSRWTSDVFALSIDDTIHMRDRMKQSIVLRLPR